MRNLSAQVSLYPLRQAQLEPAIARAIESFRAHGLEVSTGSMSTVITGESNAVFEALKSSFLLAADIGEVVMVASISNACAQR